MDVADTKRVVTPIDTKSHSDFKVAAARAGQSMASVVRRLIAAWTKGEIELSEKEDERHG